MLKWLTRLGQRSAGELAAPPEPGASTGRMSLAEAKAVSKRYFALHEQIQAAQKARDYLRVARLARQTHQLLPDFVEACKREYGRGDIRSSVAVHTGGTIMAVLQDEDGVRLLQQTLATVDEVEPWRSVCESAAEDLRLAGRILVVIAKYPGVLQAAPRDHVPDVDARRLATLATWLEKTGRVRRVRRGKRYELTPL